jgi:hypothetical protein
MEAMISEGGYRKAHNYREFANRVVFNSLSIAKEVPDELDAAFEELQEALLRADQAQNPQDELVKAQNAYICSQTALLMMDQYHIPRSYIVAHIGQTLYKTIQSLDPNQSRGQG